METEKVLFPKMGATPALGAGAGADTQPQKSVLQQVIEMCVASVKPTSSEVPLIEYIASSDVIVNTWKTRNINWILKSGAFQDKNFVKEFVQSLREKVLSLPVRVSLPKYCSELSFPRYYAIFCELDHFKVKKIIEIVGIRADNSPTKWSYRFGYWHPECQHLIAGALQQLLSSL
jgi:hypothetical protein